MAGVFATTFLPEVLGVAAETLPAVGALSAEELTANAAIADALGTGTSLAASGVAPALETLGSGLGSSAASEIAAGQAGQLGGAGILGADAGTAATALPAATAAPTTLGQTGGIDLSSTAGRPGVSLPPSSVPVENPYAVSPAAAQSPYSMQPAGQNFGGIGGANPVDPITSGFQDALNMIKSTGSGITSFAKENPLPTLMGLRLAQNAFGPSYAQPTVKKPTGQAMDMTLSPNFQGSHVISDTSVYNPTYTQPTKVAAQGGIMRGYASGGILSFDQGGIAAMAGQQPQGPQGPQGAMYPQSQQANTQYATPSQMPTSSEIVNSGYEVPTNAYTGEPTPSMAGGGVIAFSRGDVVGTPTMDMSNISLLGGPSPWSTNQDTDANTTHLAPHEAAAYRQKKLEALVSYANRAKQTAAPMGFNQTPVTVQAQQAAQGAAQPQAGDGQFAAGGILGADHSTLGGYAAGGAPRLLKGPGDGMSDNIPAVIANKQPARLADGEFVVPADVVSHLGNGSTDAGSKQLHSMMDNVRKARTGNKKQGKQIDPNKFLPA